MSHLIYSFFCHLQLPYADPRIRRSFRWSLIRGQSSISSFHLSGGVITGCTTISRADRSKHKIAARTSVCTFIAAASSAAVLSRFYRLSLPSTSRSQTVHSRFLFLCLSPSHFSFAPFPRSNAKCRNPPARWSAVKWGTPPRKLTWRISEVGNVLG